MLALGEQIEDNGGESGDEDRQEIRQFDTGEEPKELRQEAQAADEVEQAEEEEVDNR